MVVGAATARPSGLPAAVGVMPAARVDRRGAAASLAMLRAFGGAGEPGVRQNLPPASRRSRERAFGGEGLSGVLSECGSRGRWPSALGPPWGITGGKWTCGSTRNAAEGRGRTRSTCGPLHAAGGNAREAEGTASEAGPERTRDGACGRKGRPRSVTPGTETQPGARESEAVRAVPAAGGRIYRNGIDTGKHAGILSGMARKIRFEARLDEQIHRRLKRLADASGLSMNQLTEGILAWAVAKGHAGRVRPVDVLGGQVMHSDEEDGVVWFGEPGRVADDDEQQPSLVGRVYFELDYSGSRAVVDWQGHGTREQAPEDGDDGA